MAIMNFRVGHLTERSGQASSRVVQYLTREGEYKPAVPDEVAYMERTSEETVERGDLVQQDKGNLPAWANDDPSLFFAKAEAFERGGVQRKGRWATTWQIALPKELPQDEQWAMGKAFVETHLAHHAYMVVMHDPVKNGEHQPHLHVIFSERIEDGKERDAEQYFRRPEVGGCAKERWFNDRSSIEELRASWADWVNYTYERGGYAERLHPRSLRARDIDRKPEPKVGYSTDSHRQAERARIRAQRDHAKEHQGAAAGWEARKARLGITDVYHLTPERFLSTSYTRAHARSHQRWDRHAPSWHVQHQDKMSRILRHRQREAERIDRELAATQQCMRQLDRVLNGTARAHECFAVGRGADDHVKHGLTARLFEDEPTHRWGR